MNNSMVKVTCNWTQIGGCELSQAFQLLTADPDVFKRPDLDDVVDEEKSILLSKSDSSDYCELSVEIYPRYKIQALSLVCNSAKIEIFFGPIKEYLETVYGASTDELDDQFKTYRYDIEVEKSGVTELTLKFLTPSTDVCIFGIILYNAPNPNGITTLLSSSTKPTEDLSRNQHLHEFMKVTEMLSNSSNSSNATMEEFKKLIIAKEKPLTDHLSNDVVLNHLKLYIDERLQHMEERLQSRLEQIEKRHTRKLEDILKKLEKL